MHTFLLFIILASLLVAVTRTWAKGFLFSHPRESGKRHHYTVVKQLPVLSRLRYSFAMLISGFMPKPQGEYLLANFNSSEHPHGQVTYTADNAFTVSGTLTRFLMAKFGTDSAHIDLCGAADEPLGICSDAPAAGDVVTVEVLGAGSKTKRGIASAAITAGADVYTAAGGELQSEPAGAGTYWLVGRAISAATGAGDDFEFAPCKAVKVIVLAAPTQTSATTIANLHSTAVNPTKADFDALLAEAGKLQADYYALRAAMATPSLLKML